jgi:hypothetical protein
MCKRLQCCSFILISVSFQNLGKGPVLKITRCGKNAWMKAKRELANSVGDVIFRTVSMFSAKVRLQWHTS